MRGLLHPDKKQIHLLPLVAATYFMVSGGPYGIEDILGGAGYGPAIVILLVLPVLWCLPTALMIGELAAALPAEGGFYTWVRRALGPFWGFQEGWLSLTASVFDMAIYPSIFVLYLGKFAPWLTAGSYGYAWSLAVVVFCCVRNLRGAPAVGEDSVGMFVLLLAPFAVFVLLGAWRAARLHPAVQWHTAGGEASLQTAILVALWNYMGWDNASTVAQEVAHPQRNYPRAMLGATALVAASYILPLTAMAWSGLSTASFSTGDWQTAATTIGGPLLGIGVLTGGLLNGVGMFNALVMSYCRVPLAMAEDGMLPAIVARRNARGVPWVSVVLCGVAWALALKLPFERLISIDLILYGSSLLLEFVALVALRVREPELERPFRAGSLRTVCLLGVGPAVLIGYALWASRRETLLDGVSAIGFAVAVALAGPVLYGLTARPRRQR